MKNGWSFRLAVLILCFLYLTMGSLFAQEKSILDAPEFKLTDFDGFTHSLSDYKDKVVFLNFLGDLVWFVQKGKNPPPARGIHGQRNTGRFVSGIERRRMNRMVVPVCCGRSWIQR